MEPESLGLEENQNEVQDLDITGQIRDIAQVLPLEEIANLAAAEGQPAETLMNVVALIAKRFETEVCSAYLLEPDRANLVLAATVGLRRECIGNLRMAIHEGLAGLVAEQVRPLAVEQAQSHPRFKYFREAGEDPYRSFLGVPLIDRGVLQGVLVVQTVEPRIFADDEVHMLAQAAAQVAPVVSEARTPGSLHRSRAGTALGTGSQPVVELGPRCRQHLPRSESGSLATGEPESSFAAG